METTLAVASRASAANEDDRVIHQFHCNRSGSSLASNVSAASIGTVKLVARQGLRFIDK